MWGSDVSRALLVSAAVVVLGLTTTANGHGQEPAPVFRAGVRLVVQAVTVKDQRGEPVEDLGPADFAVTEDGRPQTVAFADYQRLDADVDRPALVPLSPTDDAVVSTVTRSQIQVPPPGDARYRSRRLLVFYFDLSTMPVFDRNRAVGGALAYVDSRMADADAIAIMTYDGGAVRVREDFTDDRERLRGRLVSLLAGDEFNNDGSAGEPAEGTAFGENDAQFNVFSTDRQMAALQRAIEQLRPIPEQKALVYFGSQLRLSGTDNQAQLRATVNAAVRALVTINPIDARGLVASAPMGDATRATSGGVSLFSGAAAGRLTTRLQRSQDTLYALAKDSGGEALFDTNDLSIGVVRAAQAFTSYYLVGYYSTRPEDDGRFRRVRVTLRDRPGVQLAYRDGYVTDKRFSEFTAADKERQLEDALRLDQPVTDVPMAVEVNAFRLNQAEYYLPIAVKMPGSELALARRRNAARTEIDVIGEVKDRFGITHRNVRDRLNIRLDQAQAAGWIDRPVVYETGFTLLPGDYVLKMLVRDATTGRVGTFQRDVSVANAERETTGVPLSTVVLGSQWIGAGDEVYSAGRADQTGAVNPLLIAGKRLVPSVTRVFSAAQDLSIFLYAYRTQLIDPPPLVAYAGLYRDGSKVRETPLQTIATGVDARWQGVPLSFTLSLSGLAPGAYDCQVTVLSPTIGKVSFWRASVLVTDR